MDRCTSGHTNKRTKVNNKTIKFGQTGREEPQKGPNRGKKGPTEWTRGAKRKTSKPEGREVNLVKPLGIRLTLTVLQPWSRKGMGRCGVSHWPVERLVERRSNRRAPWVKQHEQNTPEKGYYNRSAPPPVPYWLRHAYSKGSHNGQWSTMGTPW